MKAKQVSVSAFVTVYDRAAMREGVITRYGIICRGLCGFVEVAKARFSKEVWLVLGFYFGFEIMIVIIECSF